MPLVSAVFGNVWSVLSPWKAAAEGVGWLAGRKQPPFAYPDWLGRWRMAANASNDWGMDRAAQQSNAIYSGIEGIHLQDQAITESMGPIVDHALEHLAPSDQMITRTRRRLLMAARALRNSGAVPPGAEDGKVYGGARSGYFISEGSSPWQEVYARQLAASLHPPSSPLRAAE